MSFYIRTGFEVICIPSNCKATLAKIAKPHDHQIPFQSGNRGHKVGQYEVDIKSFENLVIPIMRKNLSLPQAKQPFFIIDEIGKMELFSETFKNHVQQKLDSGNVFIIGTIPTKKGERNYVCRTN